MNEREDGAWIGTVPLPERVGGPADFIQSNLSRFYSNHQPSEASDSDQIWRDFYFACFHELLAEMDASFGSAVIRAQHPTLSLTQCSISMQGTFLDALDRLADDRQLPLKEIHLGCPHDTTEDSLRSVGARLNRWQQSDAPPALEPVESELVERNLSGRLG